MSFGINWDVLAALVLGGLITIIAFLLLRYNKTIYRLFLDLIKDELNPIYLKELKEFVSQRINRAIDKEKNQILEAHNQNISLFKKDIGNKVRSKIDIVYRENDALRELWRCLQTIRLHLKTLIYYARYMNNTTAQELRELSDDDFKRIIAVIEITNNINNKNDNEFRSMLEAVMKKRDLQIAIAYHEEETWNKIKEFAILFDRNRLTISPNLIECFHNIHEFLSKVLERNRINTTYPHLGNKATTEYFSKILGTLEGHLKEIEKNFNKM